MKKYLVIGNPIGHSLSPLIHNYWMKKYHLIDSVYEKKKVEKKDLIGIVDQVRSGEIKGVNITVPYKKEIIPLLDEIKGDAQLTQSVNTLCKVNNEVHGYNTDTKGFKYSLDDSHLPNNLEYNFIDCKNKNIFIIGAGGVTSSILEAFIDTANKIYITNRTKEKAKELKKLGDISITLLGRKKNTIEVVEWGEKPEICDVVINTTSVGLTRDENLNLDFKDYQNNKNTLFYDLIYNPKETKFLKEARLRGNKTMNGKMMFIWQAQIAFHMWTGVEAEIDGDVIKLLNND
jgi:shikimate dehydrogenase|tara:strand:+ start:1353 stop:2219 length:867 start_codon:yes stop_codon:yes gene_type:complete